VGGEAEIIDKATFEDLCDHEIDASVGAVVVGLDLNFSYNKMALANLYIQKGAEFIATNSDAFDMVGGRMSPGAGVMVDSIFLSLNDSMGG
jgi:ribonucleotide monophosphatase NagD (HAD superfamily)